jgi:TMEM175 potassium channel family protein
LEKDTSRVEAFSDGVFAIAITLLILEIRVPELEGGVANERLLHSLLHLWPSFVAFLFSFFVILVMWVNHHEFMRWVRVIDYRFLFANGLVLLMVTFVPFPTAVVARYLGTPAARGAVSFYCGTFLLINLAYQVLLRSVVHRRRLVRPEVPDAVLAKVRRAYNLGLIVYAASVVVALLNAVAGLLVCASLWVLWTRLGYRPLKERKPAESRGAA